MPRLHRLHESGLVIYSEWEYMLRVENLESLITEVKKDVLCTLEDLHDIAKDLDEELGLIKREKSKTSTVYEEY